MAGSSTPARVRITAGSGTVVVVGESRDDIDVEGARGSVAGGEMRIDSASGSFTVRVPVGTDIVVGAGSGNVTLDGPLGAVSVTTDSADVQAEDVASIDARTRSGKLSVDVSRGPVRMKTKSARIQVGWVGGEVRVATVSGRIVIDEARGTVSTKTVSGAIDVFVTGRSAVTVETVSGRIRVSVPEGVKPEVRHRSVSGRRRVEIETGDDLSIVARSISGDITVSAA